MTATIENRPALVSVPDVAAATGIDQQTIRDHLERGEWPGVRIGRRRCWRVPRAVIDELLAGRDPAALRHEQAPPSADATRCGRPQK
jgi:hypothetical protein